MLDSKNADTGLWTGRARYSGSTSLSAQVGRWELAGRVRYRTRSDPSAFSPEVEGFATLDLLASYELSDRLELYGRIVNVADEDYQLTYGANAPDRGVFAGLRLRS